MNFIGIDIGTTSICGVVVDARKGKLLASLTLPNNSWLPAKHPWERMQNPAKILAAAVGAGYYKDYFAAGRIIVSI